MHWYRPDTSLIELFERVEVKIAIVVHLPKTGSRGVALGAFFGNEAPKRLVDRRIRRGCSDLTLSLHKKLSIDL